MFISLVPLELEKGSDLELSHLERTHNLLTMFTILKLFFYLCRLDSKLTEA